jgi:hypothetical protein
MSYWEPAFENHFQRIEAILRESAEGNRRAMLRMDDFDKKLKATRELGKAVVRAHLMARIASNRTDGSKR